MRETRQWSLYEKQEGRWVRVTPASFKKSVAVRMFQDLLLEGAIVAGCPDRCLRPTKPDEKIGNFKEFDPIPVIRR